MSENMRVTYTKSINKEKGDRVEFLLINFDYIDGIDYLARLFSEEFGFDIAETIDGIWFRVLRIGLNGCEYELLWHEDTGNEIYCINETDKEDILLEQRLNRILEILNYRISERNNNQR